MTESDFPAVTDRSVINLQPLPAQIAPGVRRQRGFGTEKSETAKMTKMKKMQKRGRDLADIGADAAPALGLFVAAIDLDGQGLIGLRCE